MSDPMTNSSRPIKTANLLDPRLEALEPAQKELVWAIPKAPEGMNAVQQQANSYSTAGITSHLHASSVSSHICGYRPTWTAAPQH